MPDYRTPDGSETVLLHCCCAPCSGAIIESLVHNGIRPVLFFSNSNIWPYDEYCLRKAELVRYGALFGLDVVDDDYNHSEWSSFSSEGPCISALGEEPERGARCSECFRFRLLRAAEYAKNHGITILTTTLASSRWKDLEQVNSAGLWACDKAGGDVTYWPMNWRKGGLQPRRNEIIREQGFYNQTFCGCEFSVRQSD